MGETSSTREGVHDGILSARPMKGHLSTIAATTSFGSREETVSLGATSQRSMESGSIVYVDADGPIDEPSIFAGMAPTSSRANLGPDNVTFSTDAPAAACLIVKEDLPHFGMYRGDQLLALNGCPARSVEACQALLKGSTTVVLELSRSRRGTPVEQLTERVLAPLDSTDFPDPPAFAWLTQLSARLQGRGGFDPFSACKYGTSVGTSASGIDMPNVSVEDSAQRATSGRSQRGRQN